MTLRGFAQTKDGVRTVTIFSGSKLCGGGCGRMISANKKACARCWTDAIEQVIARNEEIKARMAAEFREGSD